MQHINGAYTTYFNTKRGRSGHLFQGQYKAIVVEADDYTKELSRYIHLNPVKYLRQSRRLEKCEPLKAVKNHVGEIGRRDRGQIF